MNEYMKNLIGKFFVTSAILMSLTLVAVGYVTVTQSSQEIIYATDYAVVAAKSNNEKLELSVNDNVYELDLSFFEELADYHEILDFTPIASLKYFLYALLCLA